MFNLFRKAKDAKRDTDTQRNRAATRPFKRSFEPVSPSRAGALPSFGAPNAEIAAAGATLRNKARQAVANNGLIRNAAENLAGALVGSGIVPTSTNTLAAEAFLSDWWPVAQADGRGGFDTVQASIARGVVVDGEAICQISSEGADTRIQPLPIELLADSETRELPGGGYIISGVEHDATGRRVAYWLHSRVPASPYETWAPPVRVPAEEILHIFRSEYAGQVRGVSWLAAALLPAAELDVLQDARSKAAQVAAMYAGFIRDMNGIADGESAFDTEMPELIPGTIARLAAGEEITFSSPQQPAEISSMVKEIVRQIAAGAGVPAHMVDGDLTGANYSSLRAGLLPFRQRIEQIQYSVLVPQFLQPIWNRVAGEGVPVEWLPPAWLQVDREKDVRADVAELEAGLTSRRKLAASRGWSLEQLDAEIAAEKGVSNDE